MTAMKLQKLCYYAQAWSLVWDDKPLFKDRFQAWALGPVCPRLYQTHRGQYLIGKKGVAGDPDKLDKSMRETIDIVLEHYGDKSSQWLSDLTHQESPWKEARRGIPPTSRGETEISLGSMAEYYGSL